MAKSRFNDKAIQQTGSLIRRQALEAYETGRQAASFKPVVKAQLRNEVDAGLRHYFDDGARGEPFTIKPLG